MYTWLLCPDWLGLICGTQIYFRDKLLQRILCFIFLWKFVAKCTAHFSFKIPLQMLRSSATSLCSVLADLYLWYPLAKVTIGIQIGLTDTQGCHPTSAILWFCDLSLGHCCCVTWFEFASWLQFGFSALHRGYFSKVHNLKIMVWMWWLEVGQRSWDVNCTMGVFGACTWAGSSPKALWINRQKGWWFGNRSGQWSKVAPSHYWWKGAAWMMLGCLNCNLS